tara:strand:+ start:364 stop:651 length:288 start_codon:yes stop_codon:yes gene_type:complete
MKTSDEKFYAQRDANFKQRVYNILFDDPSGHSEEEVLELISNLSTKLEPVDIIVPDKFIESKVIITDEYADKVDTLVASMGTSDDTEDTHDSEGC